MGFLLQTGKAQARRDIAQAKALLPKVAIDDYPGDGGPEPGKVTRERMVEFHTEIAYAQLLAGDVPGAKATLGRAEALILVKGKPDGLARDGVLAAYLRLKMVAEAEAAYRKYGLYGYGALPIAMAQPAARAVPLLLSAVERSKALETLEQEGVDGKPDRALLLLDLLEYATKAGPEFTPAKQKIGEALLPLVNSLGAYEGEKGVYLCEMAYRGVNPDPAAAETALRAENDADLKKGVLALGLFFLRKDAEAKERLKLVKDGRQIPTGLVEFLGIDGIIPLAKRLNSTDPLYRTAFYYARREKPESELRLLDAIAAQDPEVPPGREYAAVARRLPKGPAQSAARKKALTVIRKDVTELERFARQNPATGGYQKSAREGDWGNYAANLAALDLALARRCFAKVTEPRHRILPLARIAQASATG